MFYDLCDARQAQPQALASQAASVLTFKAVKYAPALVKMKNTQGNNRLERALRLLRSYVLRRRVCRLHPSTQLI